MSLVRPRCLPAALLLPGLRALRFCHESILRCSCAGSGGQRVPRVARFLTCAAGTTRLVANDSLTAVFSPLAS